MRKLLIHTFLTVLIPAGLLFFVLLPGEGGWALIFALMLLLIAPFPTYITILLFRWLQRVLFPGNKTYSTLAAILILLVVYHIVVLTGYWIWEKHPLEAFASEYYFNIPACIIVISIPVAEWVMLKVERDLRAAQ